MRDSPMAYPLMIYRHNVPQNALKTESGKFQKNKGHLRKAVLCLVIAWLALLLFLVLPEPRLEAA